MNLLSVLEISNIKVQNLPNVMQLVLHGTPWACLIMKRNWLWLIELNDSLIGTPWKASHTFWYHLALKVRCYWPLLHHKIFSFLDIKMPAFLDAILWSLIWSKVREMYFRVLKFQFWCVIFSRVLILCSSLVLLAPTSFFFVSSGVHLSVLCVGPTSSIFAE